MPLVAAKCLECGGELQIDNAQDAAVCPYCGTPFVVEKAINYYTTQHVTNIGSIAHADIHVNEDSGLEAKVKNAEAYLTKHKDYAKAEALFQEITENYSHDYRGWWGIARIMTREFSGLDILFEAQGDAVEDVRQPLVKAYARQLEQVRFYVERAFNVMGPEDRRILQPIWDDFERQGDQYVEQLLDSWMTRLDEREREYDRREPERQQMLEQIKQQEKRVKKLKRKHDKLEEAHVRCQKMNIPFVIISVLGVVLGVVLQPTDYATGVAVSITFSYVGIMWVISYLCERIRYKNKHKDFSSDDAELQRMYQEYDKKFSEINISTPRSGFHEFRSAMQGS